MLKLVLSGAMSLVLIGTLIGLAGAYAITRVMSHLLFQVTPTDLATFAAGPAGPVERCVNSLSRTGAKSNESRSAGGASGMNSVLKRE